MSVALRVKRVLSNNAVLGEDAAGAEIVALGKGSGFGLRPGDAVDPLRVEQTFLADRPDDRMSVLLADLPDGCLRAAGRIAETAAQRLGLRVSQSLVLPLADHLSFALRRAQEGVVIEFPLLFEVSQLYPDEFEVGAAAVAIADEELGVRINPDEAVAIAMHLVTAKLDGPGHAHAILMTETMAKIFALVDKTFGIDVDRRSMDAARFVTHLRYVFARIATGRQTHDPTAVLFDAIAQAQPDAMRCAMKIRHLIETSFQTEVTSEETAYLALHLARLLLAAGERGAQPTPRTR